jgi:hypothetical protein
MKLFDVGFRAFLKHRSLPALECNGLRRERPTEYLAISVTAHHPRRGSDVKLERFLQSLKEQKDRI